MNPLSTTPSTPPSPPLPTEAIIREVGLRDGLQSLARAMPTAPKTLQAAQAMAA